MKLFTINGVYIKAFSKLHGLEHGFVRQWLNLSMFKLLAQKVYIFVSKAQSNQGIFFSHWTRPFAWIHFKSAHFILSQRQVRIAKVVCPSLH